MNALYPIFLKLEGRPCMVVGGGAVATRKVETLLECGARVTLVSPEIDNEIFELSRTNANLVIVRRQFEDGDLAGQFLVVAATDDGATNRRVFEKARELGIPVNAVDQPEICDFFLPASVRRGSLTIAVSTGGACPALAKKIRKMLEDKFDERYGVLLEGLEKVRRELFKRYPDDSGKRGRIMNEIVDSGIVERLGEGADVDLEKEMKKWI